MGQWLKRFFERKKFTVSISGRKNENSSSLSASDIIFVSVPIVIAPNIIKSVGKVAKKDALIVDISSVKAKTVGALKKINQPSLAIHMLFGPSVLSFKGQKVTFTIIKDDGKINLLRKILEEDGAVIVEIDGDEHDEQAALTQGLTHFINLALAKTLKDNNIDIKKHLTTPVFISQFSVMGRVLSQKAKVLSEIQTENPKVKIKLNEFLANTTSLFSILDKKGQGSLEREIKNIKSGFSPKRTKQNILPNVAKKLPNKKLKISFLGPEGTYSFLAAENIGNKKLHKLVSEENIYHIFNSVKKGASDFGVVPAENSTEGTVRETFDNLVNFDLKINGSVELRIKHNLLSFGKNLKNITTVISHPQAIAQCQKWLQEKLPEIRIITSSSTVSEIIKNKGNENIGFIGPAEAARIYKLNILAKNIQDINNNFTKFYLISKEINPAMAPTNKTLLFLSVFNRVGILRDILNVFAEHNINLSKLESRPSRIKAWDYHFFIEAEAGVNDPGLDESLNLLREYCPEITILGST